MRAYLKLLVDLPFTASPVKTGSCSCMIQGSKATAGQQRSQGDPKGMGTFSGASHTAVNFSQLRIGHAALPSSHALHTNRASAPSLLPTAAPSHTHVHGAIPCRDSHQDTHPEPVLPSLFLQRFCHVLAHPAMLGPRAPRTPTRAPRSHPAPRGALRTASPPTPASCTDPPEQRFACFPMAMPPPSSQHSLSASYSD